MSQSEFPAFSEEVPSRPRAAAALVNVRCGFPGREVFSDLNLTFAPGLSYLVGVNGAGKTTAFRLLTGEMTPAAGRVDVLGTPVARVRRGRRHPVGYLPQSFGFPPRMSALDFVAYLGWLRGMNPRAARTGAVCALERVGLSDRANEQLRRLSGGMLRRVGIAQAIVHDPALVLLDEPTAGLDPAQRIVVRDLVEKLGRDSAVVVSTHLLEDVRDTGGAVQVLHEGGLVFSGAVEELTALDPHGSIENAFLRVTGLLVDHR